MSEYIPRGYSKIPILTLYTLGNFTLVFLSCAITVFVLKLYHVPRKLITADFGQLPYLARLILFKYLSRILFLNFYFRKKDEFYDVEDEYDGIDDHLVVYSYNVKKADSKQSIKRKLKTLENFIGLSKRNNFENENLQTNCNHMLNALKYLNKSIRNSIIFQKNNSNISNAKDTKEKSMYYEEWKQAALVLDRLYNFFIQANLSK